jgi:ATP synthase protein I
MNDRQTLKDEVTKQARRIKRAEEDRPTLLAQAVHLGTLGLMLVLPIVVGAYLGRWLDEQMAGYSMRWTLSLMALGVVIGAWTVYRAVKETP